MQKNYWLIPFLLICIFSSSHAQQWLYFSSSNIVKDIEFDGSKSWIATNGSGLVQADTEGQNAVFLNKANSGLPDNQLSSLALGGSGKLWVGTFENGVASYDGTVWQHFNKANSALTDNEINSVATTSDGTVWAGGLTLGVAKYDGQDWQVLEQTPDGDPLFGVFSMQASGTDLWIATVFGLVRYDGSSWSVFNTSNSGIPDDFVLDVALDQQDGIWVSTFSGIARFDGNANWTTFTTTQGGNQLFAEVIEVDAAGNVWAGGTAMNGIAIYNGAAWTDMPVSPAQPVDEAISFKQHPNGSFWAGTFGGGLYRLKAGAWEKLEIDQSLIPHSATIGIAIDQDDNKWIATGFGGLAKISNGFQDWEVFDTTNSPLPRQETYKVHTDDEGAVWLSFSLDNSVARFHGGTWNIYDANNSNLPDDAATALASGTDGYAWAGFLSSGLARFEGTEWVQYPLSYFNAPTSEITSIAIDSANTLWAGTYDNGLLRWSGGQDFQWFTQVNGLPSDNITSVLVRTDGQIWVGTGEDGIAQWDGSDWNIYNSVNSPLVNDNITSLSEDTGGKLWVGTLGGGLFNFDGSEWAHLDIYNSAIPNDYIDDVAEDDTGNIWVCSHYAGLGVLLKGSSAVKEHKENQLGTVGLFPNPTSGSLSIKLEQMPAELIKYATILSKNGVARRINNFGLSREASIDVSDLPSGNYTIVLQTYSNKVFVSMFAKVN